MKADEKKMTLFSPEKVNTGRQTELDIARGLAVFFMVLVHVQMFFSKKELTDSAFGEIIDFLGGIPAAPVFMFLMGVGFLYTGKTDFKRFIKRGIVIFLAGYFLNFLRGSLPEIVSYFISGNVKHLDSAVEIFIEVDIFQFAGLSMLFFAFLKWRKISLWGIGLIGLGLSLLNFVFLSIKVDGYFLQAITGLLWGSNKFSSFPFLSWVFYPVSGYMFATLLIRCVNTPLFYKRLLIGSLLLLILFSLLFGDVFKLDLGMHSEMGYYHHKLPANIVYLLFCLFWISSLFTLIKILPRFIINQFKRWSKNVSEIYFLHWVIIGWLAFFLNGQTFGLLMYLILTLSIYGISDWIAYVLAKKNITI